MQLASVIPVMLESVINKTIDSEAPKPDWNTQNWRRPTVVQTIQLYALMSSPGQRPEKMTLLWDRVAGIDNGAGRTIAFNVLKSLGLISYKKVECRKLWFAVK